MELSQTVEAFVPSRFAAPRYQKKFAIHTPESPLDCMHRINSFADMADLVQYLATLPMTEGADHLADVLNKLCEQDNAPEIMARLLLAVDSSYFMRLAAKAKTSLANERPNALVQPAPENFERDFGLLGSARRMVESDVKLLAAIQALPRSENSQHA